MIRRFLALGLQRRRALLLQVSGGIWPQNLALKPHCLVVFPAWRHLTLPELAVAQGPATVPPPLPPGAIAFTRIPSLAKSKAIPFAIAIWPPLVADQGKDHWRQVSPVPMLELDYEETVADLESVARLMR